MDVSAESKERVELGSPDLPVVPLWRQKPCHDTKLESITPTELKRRINDYFRDRTLLGLRPTLSDLAGVCKYDSVAQMLNEARRGETAKMRYVSQACLAIQANYEELAQTGLRTATYMLERIPTFDYVEGPAQKPDYHFKNAQETVLRIKGVIDKAQQGQELSPEQAYAKLMKCRTYEEVQQTIELAEQPDGTYAAIEFDSDTEQKSA